MLRYSEIPHDFSSDSLHFAELGEDQIYRALRDDSPPSDVSIQSNGPLMAAQPATSMPVVPSSAEKKKRADKFLLRSSNSSASDLAEVIRMARTKKNSLSGQSGGSGSGVPATCAMSPLDPQTSQGACASKKSNSLPSNASIHDLDAVICSALRVSPEELANQITLLDFPVFAAIQPDELTSCAWTKKNKHITTPNIVAFTKRFNHTSFWTVQEILGGSTPKSRAEVLAHFIRVAKKLYELNNLHSLFAIVSAMQSASIYRLNKTWSCLTKKERATFDRLADIFNDKDNWSTLREYLESLKLPCIPYIGLFLTDLVYIDLAYPHKGGGLEPEQRTLKMNNILRVIANYQNSDYTTVAPMPHIQKYLQSVRYIEELQNIFEEDQYKQSLKLEPQPSANGSAAMLPPGSASCSSKESIGSHAPASQMLSTGNGTTPQKSALDTIALESLNLSPAKSIGSMRSTSSVSSSKFIPGHRKCRSLGTKCRSTSLPRNFHQKCACTMPLIAVATTLTRTLPGNRCKCRIFKTNAQVGVLGQGNGSTTGISSGYGGSNASGLMTSNGDLCNDSTISHHQSRHLLDDSVIEEKSGGELHSPNNAEVILAAVTGKDRKGLRETTKDAVLEYQGCIRRKTLLKEGRKPAVASWQRYWLQVWANHLVFFPPKTFKGNERGDFKREPCKVCPLDGWHVEQMEGQQHANSFQLINISTNTVYKFRTSTTTLAGVWVDVLHHIITVYRTAEPRPIPVNLMSFE